MFLFEHSDFPAIRKMTRVPNHDPLWIHPETNPTAESRIIAMHQGVHQPLAECGGRIMWSVFPLELFAAETARYTDALKQCLKHHFQYLGSRAIDHAIIEVIAPFIRGIYRESHPCLRH